MCGRFAVVKKHKNSISDTLWGKNENVSNEPTNISYMHLM